MNNEINKALKPFKDIANFTINKGIPAAVTLCSLPVHGINYCIFKQNNPGQKYNYNGSKITKATKKISSILCKIPSKLADRCR